MNHAYMLHDTVEYALVVVVLPGPPGVHAFTDELQHKLHALLLGDSFVEPLLERLDGALPPPKAREPAVLHALDHDRDALRVSTDRQETLNAQDFKIIEQLARFPVRTRVHHLQKLPG